MSIRVVAPFGRAITLTALQEQMGQPVEDQHRNVWVTLDPVVFIEDHNYERTKHVIEPGFMTDLASAPWVLGWLLDPLSSPWRTAAVAHDASYAYLAPDRRTADRWWREIALARGAAPWRARLTWLGLRAAGYLAWRSNRKQYAEHGAQWRHLKGDTP